MKTLFIVLIIADIIFTMMFLPWGMLVNAAIMILTLAILLPIFYFRLLKNEKK